VADLKAFEFDVGVEQRVERDAQVVGAGQWKGQGAGLSVDRGRMEHPCCAAEIGGVSELYGEAFGADLGLELPGGAPCHDPAVVEYGDLGGEGICLVEVLGREQDRGLLAREFPDDIPEDPAATWIEPGGGLVEEDHWRGSEQAGGEVEPAALATGVGAHAPVRGVRQVELLEQFVCATSGTGAIEVCETPQQQKVLPSCEQLVDRGVLAGQTDRAAHVGRLAGDVVAVDTDPSRVEGKQRGQNPYQRRLPGPIGTKQPEDRPARDRQVDPLEDRPGPEALAQPIDPHCHVHLRLWRVSSDHAHGTRQALSVERVVTAAIEVADEQGLAAVSMSRVADRLGASTMALYRHVANKHELLALMVDGAAGPPPGLPLDAGWRPATEAWARALARISKGWVIEVPISGPPIGPNSVAWMEAGLRALRDSGLGSLERLAVITTLSGYVRQHAALLQSMSVHTGGRPQRQVELEWRQTLAAFIDPQHFPEVSAVLSTAAFDAEDNDPEGDPDFEFGLDCILEGVTRLAERDDR
jgi:AcrR family transcriptional regulator